MTAPTQYMLPNGVWLESCEAGTQPSDPKAIPAPADTTGFHGMEGLWWDGSTWLTYVPTPDSCTALQGRLALGEARCEQIAAMLPAMPWAARQAWEYAQSWQRKSALLASLAAAFGMSENEVDNLFRFAVTLEV